VFHKLYCLRAVAGTMKLKGRGYRWDAGKWYMPLDLLSCRAGCVESSMKGGVMMRWKVAWWTDSE